MLRRARGRSQGRKRALGGVGVGQSWTCQRPGARHGSVARSGRSGGWEEPRGGAAGSDGTEPRPSGGRGWRVGAGCLRAVLRESCLPPATRASPRHPSASWVDASSWHLLRACVLRLEPRTHLEGLFSGSRSLPFYCPTRQGSASFRPPSPAAPAGTGFRTQRWGRMGEPWKARQPHSRASARPESSDLGEPDPGLCLLMGPTTSANGVDVRGQTAEVMLFTDAGS